MELKGVEEEEVVVEEEEVVVVVVEQQEFMEIDPIFQQQMGLQIQIQDIKLIHPILVDLSQWQLRLPQLVKTI